MKMKVKFLAVVCSALLAPSAFAASVITGDMATAVSTAFGDLKDTVGDLIGTALPVVVAVAVVLAIPAIVKRLIRMASH